MTKKTDIPKLTIKQSNFAKFFVESGNASEAYRKSYNTSRMKPESVWRKASEALENVKVSARIKSLKEELDKEDRYSLEKVLDGFGQIAFYNIIDIFDFVEESIESVEGEADKVHPARLMLTGGAKKLSELPREITACISSLKQTKDGVEVKMYCRDNALAQIARMKGFYAPEKVITAESTLADLIR